MTISAGPRLLDAAPFALDEPPFLPWPGEPKVDDAVPSKKAGLAWKGHRSLCQVYRPHCVAGQLAKVACWSA